MAVDEMYLENLDEFVNDENRIVTYKWLSRQLSVHVNQAKQMLYTFVEKQRNEKDVDLNVTYFVAGGEIKKDGTKVQKVLVVPEENLDATKTSLSPLTSCHIYSIQKAKLKDSNALYIADYDTLKENIFNSNKYSAITCTTAKPRSQEEIVRLSAKAQPTTQAVSFSKPNKDNGTSQPKLPVKPANIAGMFAQAGAKKKDGNKEKEKTNTEKKTEEKPKPESKSKPKQGGVMSFFQKQANKPASVKPDIKKESPTKLPEKKEEKVVEKVQKEVKKEEKKSEKAKSSTGNRKKKADSSDEEGSSRKPQTKRRRIKAAIVDSSSSEEDMDDEPESPIPPTPPRASSPPVPDSPTKGETSDEDIDEEAEQTSARDTQPSQSETAPSDGDNGNDGKRRRKRRRKQVTKTTVDEDGFMTTEKVWESDSTDASETEAPVKVAPPTVTTKQQPKKPADKNKEEEKKKTPPKKSAVSKGAGKQMSMMNFFKKK